MSDPTEAEIAGEAEEPAESELPAEIVRLEAVVHGRVQGVGFRVFVADFANGCGLAGWVRNEADATVRCVAEGPRDRLEALAARLRDGPWGARVDSVQLTWSSPSGEQGSFRVRAGSHPGD